MSIESNPVLIKIKLNLITDIRTSSHVMIVNNSGSLTKVEIDDDLRVELIKTVPFFLACLLCDVPEKTRIVGSRQRVYIHTVLHALLGPEMKILLKA